MRNAFAQKITEIGKIDQRVILLSGDIGNRLFDDFKTAQPERFLNCGVAEQNMTGVAAGLAIGGYRPFTYTIAPFCTTRCLEQIKIDVAYHDVPVTIVSVGAGLAYAGLGPTHHACEDIAFLRAIPNMNVICPADKWEVRAAVKAVLEQNNPSYIRLGKKGEPEIHSGEINDFSIGQGIEVLRGDDVAIIATGNIVHEALISVENLRKKGISCSLISLHTVKPLDQKLILDVVKKYKLIVSIEEHSVIGGLGSSISEFLFRHECNNCNFYSLGTPDKFYKESGSQLHARSVLELDSQNIEKA